MEARADELRLTIERGSDPIAGYIGLVEGPELRFEGYVQLVVVLERVRSAPPADESDEGGKA